jgi:hypothetical protein
MEMSGQRHSPAALPPQKGSRYPLTRRLGESQNRCALFGEEILKWLLPRFKLQMVQPVAESLYWLCYRGFPFYGVEVICNRL